MKRLAAVVLAAGTLVPAPAAHAQALFPYCRADRLYVVYEASEGFVLHGAAESAQATSTTIRCTIVRFGTDVVATSARSCPGPACATADVVQTPYGGMSVCTSATYVYLDGHVLTSGPSCTPIPAP
jgi:hypothetical protein